MCFKKNRLILLSVLLLSFVQSVNAAPASKHIESDTAIQNEVLVHINEYRRHRGLPKLTMNNNMVREAKQHSLDMANHKMSFGHKYFDKRISKLHAQIKNSGAGAENVAYNYKDARTVVQQWVLSPGHKRNIVGNYNLTGVGIARDKQGKIYYTQIFLRTGPSPKQNTQHVARRASSGISFQGIPWVSFSKK